jgi:predicted Zn-dependent peptidase
MQLMSYDRSGWDFRDILAFPAWADGLRAETLQTAASRYLRTSNYVQVSLVPEILPVGTR